MKQIIIFFLICLTACNQKQTDNEQLQPLNKEALAKAFISKYLKEEFLQDSSVYKPISWGVLDSIENPVSFTYRMSHVYNGAVTVFSNNKSVDSIVQQNMTFMLDSNFRVSSVVETKHYQDFYDNKGVSYKMYGDRDLELIGRSNSFDMVFFENNKNRLLIVGGKHEIKSKSAMSKEKWIQTNIHGMNNVLLSETDTIEYCLDVTGNDCKYYIFKAGKLIEEKNTLESE